MQGRGGSRDHVLSMGGGCRWDRSEISADGGRMMHICSDLTCIKWCIMVVADVGGRRVVGRGFSRLSFAHKVLSEGEASVVAKCKGMGSSSVSLGGAPPSRGSGNRSLFVSHFLR